MSVVRIVEQARARWRERSDSRFDRQEARVSAVGLCARRQVAQALGEINDPFPEIFKRAGYMHEQQLAEELRLVHPDLEEQLEVPTITGGTTHPDFYLPSLRWAIQLKTSSEDGTAGKTLKPHHRDQCRLEWASWRRAGYAMTRDGRRIGSVPVRYWLLMLSRDSYGITMSENEIRWDNLKAEMLERRLEQNQALIDAGIIPDRDKPRPDFECKHPKTGEINCSMFRRCWSSTNGGGES